MGLVTFIAMYHYFRIFNSFVESYTPCFISADGEVNIHKCDADKYGYRPTGIPFNDAYRYVDWLLTVPLLLIEIVLVMRLDKAETYKRCTTLGICSALMIPFAYIVYTLFFGLKESQNSQPECARDLVKYAC